MDDLNVHDAERTEGLGDGVRLVGIGASAGGLEALRVLLEALPDSDQLSYVIAQHVSPTHVSMLRNLLSPMTGLRVQDLTDGQSPEAGVVYITPPNKDVVLNKGVLSLTEPKAAIGPKPSVNHFFHSLAEGLGEQAIGIILSGTGGDGATGMRAIKAAGGFTIAQEPETAKYDGMPKAAIHTGAVDLILAPTDIGPALARLMVLPRDLPAALRAEEETDEYAQISNLVRLGAAFKLNDYKPATIKRRIARRMNLVGVTSLKDYIKYLKANREESQLLMRDTFISVTSFFRDPDAFNALESAIAEVVRRRSDGEVIRCWVPGCASGEEVYSIAMLLEECIGRLSKSGVQYMVFASDLDEEALEIARAALYPISDLGEMPKAMRDQYLELVGDHCRVVKRIRNRIVFTRQNVIEDPPFGRLDLISCRNLLIYLVPPVQKRVMEVFHYALNPGGYLFLGRSESVDQHDSLFLPENARMRVYRRAEGVAQYALPMPQDMGRGRTGSRRSGEGNMMARTDFVSMRAQEVLVERYAPPSVVINGEDNVVYFQGDLKAYFNFPKGGANLYLFDLVDPAMRAELRALVFRCRRDMSEVQGSLCAAGEDNTHHLVRPTICPLNVEQKALLLVSFPAASLDAGAPVEARLAEDGRDNLIISELEQELANTRAHLNVVVEELETSNEELQSLNEELQSTNEELQSTNEELQTSNEELQSTNEELLTVNEELQVKSVELEVLANDLVNVKESLTYPLLVVDAKLRVTQVNGACGVVVAVDAPLEGSSLNSVQWLLPVPGLAGSVRAVIQSGNSHRDTLIADSGMVFELNIMPYRCGKNDITGAVILFRDITAEYSARAELKRTHERFELAVQGSTDGLWDWDPVSGELFLAPRFKEILGYRDEEMESSYAAWESRVHADDIEATRAAVQATLEHNVPYAVEYRMRHRSGEYIWIEARGKVVEHGAEGRPRRMAGSITDISARKAVEKALYSAMSRLELATKAAEIGIWGWEFDSNRLTWDSAMYKLYQVPDELKGDNLTYAFWQSRCHPEDLPRAEAELAAARCGDNPYDSGFRIVLPNGSVHDIQAAAVLERDSAGRSIGFVGINRDLTHERTMERGLRESESL